MQGAHLTWVFGDVKRRRAHVTYKKKILQGELHLDGKQVDPAVGRIVFQHSTTHRLFNGINPYMDTHTLYYNSCTIRA